MAEKTDNAGLSREDVVKIVGEQLTGALKPLNDAQAELTKNIGIIADTLKADREAAQAKDAAGDKAADKAGEKKGPATAEEIAAQVEKLVNAKIETLSKSQETAAARDRFVSERMAKFPAAYRAQIGHDPAKFEEQLKSIQSQFETDFKAAGGKITDVAAPGSGGKPPETTLDPSKLTPKQFAETYLAKVPGAVVAQEKQAA
jgi:hypothetical protein